MLIIIIAKVLGKEIVKNFTDDNIAPVNNDDTFVSLFSFQTHIIHLKEWWQKYVLSDIQTIQGYGDTRSLPINMILILQAVAAGLETQSGHDSHSPERVKFN